MSETRRNVEIKARVADLAETRRRVQQLATQPPVHCKQTDTYFTCRMGRLKLRETVGRPAQLIWYDRPNLADPRISRYQWVEIPDADLARDVLAAALGIQAVVRKRREVYLYRFVRIHLDQVEILGDFIELEAVLESGIDEVDARRVLADLIERLEISPESLVGSSYVDML